MTIDCRVLNSLYPNTCNVLIKPYLSLLKRLARKLYRRIQLGTEKGIINQLINQLNNLLNMYFTAEIFLLYSSILMF